MYQRRTPRDTSRYRRERRRFLDANPLCAGCAKLGFTAAATELDHIVPYHKRPDLFWDTDNWQGLCADCHQKKSDAERRKLRGCGVDGWPV